MLNATRIPRLLFAGLLAGALALGGCSGEDGVPGPQGPEGPSGTDGTDGTTGQTGPSGPTGDGISTTETCALCHNPGKFADVKTLHRVGVPVAAPYTVTVTSAGLVGGAFEIQFRVMNGSTAVTNVTAGSSGNLRVNLSRLQPAADGNPSRWVNYVPSSSTERTGTLTNNDDGTYKYRFTTDVVTAGFNAASTDTHRVAGQISGGTHPATNLVHDFVPAGGPATSTRELVKTASCNACHERLVVHGSRYDVDYCVTCHNPGRGDAGAFVLDGEILGDMTVMTHKIHKGHGLSKDYPPYGSSHGTYDYNHATYPQDLRNCTTCHAANAANSDAWKTNYSVQACQACHDDKWFGAPASRPEGMVQHTGGAAGNGGCTSCHKPGSVKTIEEAHRIYPEDAANFTYEIDSVTYNTSGKPVVKFRIRKNGAAITDMHEANKYPPASNNDVAGFTYDPSATLKGFAGGPSFLIAYAAPQDDVTRPADWNQKGRVAGQPQSVTVQSIISGDAPDGNGWYTRTLTAASIPADATMRGVALQGYFTQCATGQDKCRTDATGAYGRYTTSVYKGPTGTGVAQRRVIVDNAKCLNCHKQLALHGGNRVNDVMTCVICHNPNLSSSGRAANLSLTRTGSALAATNETIAALGDNPLTYPEDMQNMKDMIHGIHAAAKRTVPYEHVRDRGTSGVYYYDWSHVTYPGILRNCETCHLSNTYATNIPAGALMTTVRTTTGKVNETRDEIVAVRATVPNLTDEVKNPISAACNGCHTTLREVSHMQSMGAGFGTRGTVLQNR
jgi:OmcA/MtrC family decaheme c-type cytochrome